MGLGTILQARKVLLMALGEHKARIVKETAEGTLNPKIPASNLKNHPDAVMMLDDAAASELTARKTPWKLGSVEWDEKLTRRAVLWLSRETGKALLKLDEDAFREHGLHELLRKRGFRGPVYTNPACRDLARILLADGAAMSERDAERVNRKRQKLGDARRVEALYTLEDAMAAIQLMRTVRYGQAVEVLPLGGRRNRDRVCHDSNA
jgi:hypothetical protein